jgi:hypothetical protein
MTTTTGREAQAEAAAIMRSAIVEELTRCEENGIDPFVEFDAPLRRIGERLETEWATAKAAGSETARHLFFHGVERIVNGFDEAGNGVDESDPPEDVEWHRLAYLNSGETYRATVCVDLSDKVYFVGSWGDWVESRVPEALADDEEIKAITDRILAGASGPRP